MGFKTEHENHTRRFGRNLRLGLSLAAFVVLVLALTMVKVTSGDFKFPQTQAEQN
jgi:hypothetical protein